MGEVKARLEKQIRAWALSQSMGVITHVPNTEEKK